MSKTSFESKTESYGSLFQNGGLFSKKEEFAFNLAIILGIILFFTLVFKDVVYQGKSISKVYEISKIDPFYTPTQRAAKIFCPIDPSIYSNHIPAYVFNERTLHGNSFPFWNEFTGSGYPHAASIENGLFHPIRLVMSSMSEHSYNLMIVVKAIIAALGTFGLVRTIGLSRWSALFASIIYPLSPFILRETELHFETWFYPLILWVFISMMRRSTPLSSVLIGFCSAFTVLSLHPTCTIYILSTSVSIGYLKALLQTEKGERLQRFWQVTRCLFLAAVIAFCLTAPILLSFFELVSNSWNYKGSMMSNPGVSWAALALLLVNPAVGGASLYLGITSAILIPLAIVYSDKRILPFTISGVLAFLCFTTLTPIHHLFEIHPFTFLKPHYYLPLYLLLATVIASYGIDLIRGNAFEKDFRKWAFLILSLIVVVGTPFVFKQFCIPFTGFRWDGGMPCFDINMNAWRRDLVLAVCFLSTLIVGQRFLKSQKQWVIPLSLIGISLFSLLPVSRHALPVNPGFFFPEKAPVAWLKEKGKRVLAKEGISGNLWQIFGVRDFAFHSGFYLYRYVEFLKLCGASNSYVSYGFSNRLTPFLDAASVKYLLGYSPILFSDDKIEPPEKISLAENEVSPVEGVSLAGYGMFYDRSNSQILGKLTWKVAGDSARNLGFQYLLLDQSGHPIWTGFERPMPDSSSEAKGEVDLAISVPLNLPQGTPVYAAVRVTDVHSSTPLKPSKCSMKLFGNNIALEKLTVLKGDEKERKFHLRLLSENESGYRVYENSSALPDAYVVHKVQVAEDARQAFKFMKEPGFNFRDSAVIETTGKNAPNLAKELAHKDEVSISRPDSNSVSINVETKSGGLLVLTDAYYPGWIAYVDDIEANVYPANGLFRGVKIPAGKHSVVFRYFPTHFKAGMALFLICILSISVYFLLVYRKSRATGKLQ